MPFTTFVLLSNAAGDTAAADPEEATEILANAFGAKIIKG